MAGTAYGRRDRPTKGAAHNPRPAARPCPDAARSAPRSSAIRFARHASPNTIESLRGFSSDGDDVGDTAAGGSFLPSFDQRESVIDGRVRNAVH
jgi:hypothetical protein